MNTELNTTINLSVNKSNADEAMKQRIEFKTLEVKSKKLDLQLMDKEKELHQHFAMQRVQCLDLGFKTKIAAMNDVLTDMKIFSLADNEDLEDEDLTLMLSEMYMDSDE